MLLQRDAAAAGARVPSFNYLLTANAGCAQARARRRISAKARERCTRDVLTGKNCQSVSSDIIHTHTQALTFLRISGNSAPTQLNLPHNKFVHPVGKREHEDAQHRWGFRVGV